MPGYGWTTFDPTPPDPSPHGLALLSRLGLYLDAAETFWQRWVVGYDPSQQGTLADRILAVRWLDRLSGDGIRLGPPRGGRGCERFGPAAGVALGGGAVVLAGGATPGAAGAPAAPRAAGAAGRGQRGGRHPALRADAAVLRRHGYQKPVWFTPVEFARSLPGTDLGRVVEEFTAAYNALRFGGRMDAAPRMSMLLDEMSRLNG